MLNPEKLAKSLDQAFEESALPSLVEYIKIPCKSPFFDSKWEEHGFIEAAIQHVQHWCQAQEIKGLEMEVLRLPGRTPLLWLRLPGEGEESILLYGHLDKQPEMVGWAEDLGPWTPKIKNNRLYGRGAADDGYAIYSAILALQALQNQGIKHAPCELIFECCEESGSHDLPFYMDYLKNRMKKPSLVITLDSGAGNYEQLWVTSSLRGNVVGELSVELVKEGLHSGKSGLVADSFRVARELLSRLEDEQSGVIRVKALQGEIPAENLAQAEKAAEVLGTALCAEIPFHAGVLPNGDAPLEWLLNMSWRPTLTVTGAAGLPALEDAGNVLRPKTVLKLSLRLPPSVDPAVASKLLSEILTEDPPYQAKVNFSLQSASSGWVAPRLSAWLSAALQEASETFYKKPALFLGEGGTIPFMAMLGKQFPEAEFVITGVLGPQSNAHGPNEFLDLPMVKKLTACIALIIHRHVQKENE